MTISYESGRVIDRSLTFFFYVVPNATIEDKPNSVLIYYLDSIEHLPKLLKGTLDVEKFRKELPKPDLENCKCAKVLPPKLRDKIIFHEEE